MELKDVQVFRLDVEAQFQCLSARERRYAHHMARAAWSGARIVMRQTSPESIAIYDFILELYRSCSGDWDALLGQGITSEDLNDFLTYAAAFLSNLGNYFGSGDQKFVPAVDSSVLRTFAARSPRLGELYAEMAESIYSVPPYSLGYPSTVTQSSYYPGNQHMTKEEISTVSKVLEERSIFPENTRIRKCDNGTDFEVLIASIENDVRSDQKEFPLPGGQGKGKGVVRLVRGDHSRDLEKICNELLEATKYASNDVQRRFLEAYIASYRTGSLDTYRESLRLWVRDKAPAVENIFGFVEPYRDPHGIRAEWEGLVAIANPEETRLLAALVEHSGTFIRRLPWATTAENDGRGPFEKRLFEPPDFSSIHSLAYCSSIIFPGINVPNYNDIRQEDGFKSVIVANRMLAEGRCIQYPFIDEPGLAAAAAAAAETFRKHKFPAYYMWVVLHELFGHGTGKMMVETKEGGGYNFDIKNPPIDPVTGRTIAGWYRPGQTWTGQFGDLATTVDECRAELVGAYLMHDTELLGLFGFPSSTSSSSSSSDAVLADDITYNLYHQLGVDGLRGLANYNVDSGRWGQAHSRAHFAMLKCLLEEGDGVITITHKKGKDDDDNDNANTNNNNDNDDDDLGKLTVRIDREKITTRGKPALGRMLLKLHMYRCTADAGGCREYYEKLSAVEDVHVEWRRTVLRNKPPPMVFVHANTFLQRRTGFEKRGEDRGEEGDVVLKEYAPTVRGLVESWAERGV
ncbi:peptidase family M49-domain-containing protein [Xylaria arbuscula]|nr:peptidase family M49-domain-containing protein [Xylaria arbuscula]